MRTLCAVVVAMDRERGGCGRNATIGARTTALLGVLGGLLDGTVVAVAVVLFAAIVEDVLAVIFLIEDVSILLMLIKDHQLLQLLT